MITIPIEDFTPQENEELKTICHALFIEVEDKRLISIMSKEEVADYTSNIMEDSVCEDLYEMVGIFGEQDFITFIKPVISSLASSDYNKDTYLQLFKNSVEDLT